MSENQKNRIQNLEHICVVPSTKVTCGCLVQKEISNIIQGDTVVSQTGKEQFVKRVATREIDENIYKLNIQSENENLNIMGNQNVRAIIAKDISCKFKLKNKRPQKCTFLLHKNCSTIKNSLNQNCIIKELKIQDIKVSDLKENDYLICPVYKKSNIVPIDINVNRARLLGYYAAEGCININEKKSVFCVQFTLNMDERETLAKEISELVKIEFGSKVGFYNYPDHPNTLTLKFQNKNAINFFTKYCQGKAPQKTFHNDILNLPEELQKNIIACYILGDGHFSIRDNIVREISISSASCNLLCQVKNIIHQWGWGTAKIREGESMIGNKIFTGYSLSFSDSTSQVLLKFFKHINFLVRNKTTKNSCSVMNGFVLKRINKIDIIRYRGKAYSLETEGDNNYIANGVVVNNV
jgi:hypothetical protein